MLDLQDIERWQWLLAGAAAGLLVGLEPRPAGGRDPVMRYPMSEGFFLRQVRASGLSRRARIREYLEQAHIGTDATSGRKRPGSGRVPGLRNDIGYSNFVY